MSRSQARQLSRAALQRIERWVSAPGTPPQRDGGSVLVAVMEIGYVGVRVNHWLVLVDVGVTSVEPVGVFVIVMFVVRVLVIVDDIMVLVPMAVGRPK